MRFASTITLIRVILQLQRLEDDVLEQNAFTSRDKIMKIKLEIISAAL